MNKKKVLLISPVLEIGGAEKVVRDIAYNANRDVYEIHLLVLKDTIGVYEQELLQNGCKAFHVPEPSENYIAYLRALISIMKKEQYSIVHVHTMFSCGWAMLAAKIAGVPVRITHSHSSLDNGGGLIKQIYETCMRFLILTCSTDLIACGEKAGIRLLGEKAYRKRGQLVLNGIDVNSFRFNPQIRQDIRQQLGWQDSFLMGHAGHLMQVKNQTFLLDLMPSILERCPNARLLLLGEGKDRSMLEQKVQSLGLSDKVLLPGNVSNVADYLSAMDVFVFPSIYEGMPLSVMEAQANGLPCVLSTGVPKDVYLTDLIYPLSLSDDRQRWLEAILSSRREKPEGYAEQLRTAGFDLSGAMEKIYKIYAM